MSGFSSGRGAFEVAPVRYRLITSLLDLAHTIGY